MNRRWWIPIILVLFLLVPAGWYVLGGDNLSADDRAAANHSIEYVAKEYSLEEKNLEIETVNYWEEEDRYAIRLIHINDNKQYEIALRLDDDREVAFMLDVTGQFDEFGLAYCH
ncbi:hypothetical protein J2S74_003480 [Evansella vedderi]|uniref:PepSY domain-containing protein n=1 Tax=Evansella vedderi TaxID=38282 RepID=A0ABT9ZXW1_9BACI|nr:hypothetical protein [Evansella vedderi]MDQ0256081.1 hypothetical protein [Evansella vedderi]